MRAEKQTAWTSASPVFLPPRARRVMNPRAAGLGRCARTRRVDRCSNLANRTTGSEMRAEKPTAWTSASPVFLPPRARQVMNPRAAGLVRCARTRGVERCSNLANRTTGSEMRAYSFLDSLDFGHKLDSLDFGYFQRKIVKKCGFEFGRAIRIL